MSIALHWLTVLLFVAAYTTMEFRDLYPKGSESREAMKSWHYVAGISIFAIAWLRLCLRALTPPQPRGHAVGRWQAVARTTTHLALYVLMIALPLIGWLILSAGGDPVPFLGFELPPLIGANSELAEQLEDTHELIARLGYGLIGIHALAGLIHHYVTRDAALAPMLPARP
jgi:superoxide oxidase